MNFADKVPFNRLAELADQPISLLFITPKHRQLIQKFTWCNSNGVRCFFGVKNNGTGMTDAHQQTVTQLLRKVNQGQTESFDELFHMVYDHLYAIAKMQRKKWSGNQTMNTTALVHEAYLKLVDQDLKDKNSRAHFYATASTAMRHILIDYARDQNRIKRGGDRKRITLNGINLASGKNPEFSLQNVEILLILEKAIQKLEKISPRQSKIIECRFFGGMSIEDTAAALNISPSTVKRGWKTSRLWLYREMKKWLE